MRSIKRSARVAAVCAAFLGGAFGLNLLVGTGGNIDWPAPAPAHVAAAGTSSGAIDWP